MDDDAAIAYYAKNVPVDHSLLAPLGLMTWAAIRLHHTIRDTLGIHLGTDLSDSPFNSTLGGVISELVKTAQIAGEPWATSIEQWASTYGRPAVRLRDRITHSVAYTAPDGLQALRTSPDPRHPSPERVKQAFSRRRQDNSFSRRFAWARHVMPVRAEHPGEIEGGEDWHEAELAAIDGENVRFCYGDFTGSWPERWEFSCSCERAV